jgi:hypothetical protein
VPVEVGLEATGVVSGAPGVGVQILDLGAPGVGLQILDLG